MGNKIREHKLNKSSLSSFSNANPYGNVNLNSDVYRRNDKHHNLSNIEQALDKLSKLQLQKEIPYIELKTKGELCGIPLKIYKLIDTRLQDPIDWVESTNESFDLCEISLETRAKYIKFILADEIRVRIGKVKDWQTICDQLIKMKYNLNKFKELMNFLKKEKNETKRKHKRPL